MKLWSIARILEKADKEQWEELAGSLVFPGHFLRERWSAQQRTAPSLVTVTARPTVNCLNPATSPVKSHLYRQEQGQYENSRPSETDFLFNSTTTLYITGLRSMLRYFESQHQGTVWSPLYSWHLGINHELMNWVDLLDEWEMVPFYIIIRQCFPYA